MFKDILNFSKKHIFKILFLILSFYVIWVYASSNIWDFSSSSDYTYSVASDFTVSWSIATLNKNTLVHTWVITNATNYNWAYDVVVDWNYAYMTSFLWDRLNVLDISNPSSPTLVWSIINNGGTIRLDWAAWLIKDGNYLYVASNASDAIQIINVSNPAAPTQVWQLFNATTLNWARGLTKLWNYLYVAVDTYDALQVIDVTNPATPTIAWTYRNATNMNWAREVKISWNYAFVTCYNRDALSVIDISTPTSPVYVTQLREVTNLNWAWNLEISWNYAYVSAYLNDSVRVIDISTPTAPVAVTSISWWSYSLTNPMDLVVEWNYLYIASFWLDAINIADISNPTIPVFVSKVLHNATNPLLDWANGLFIVWDLVYTAVYNSDALEVLRLTYPSNSPYLQPVTAFNYWITNNLLNFSETLWAWNEGSITYQISKDNWTTWYYWNWSSRTTTIWWVANSNLASVINANLSLFNAVVGGTGQFTFRAYFTSNWIQKVELDNVNVTASDPASPGWISTNLSIWLKADKWTSSTTDWASITSWADQSGNWYDTTTWVAPSYINNDVNNLNYNPLIDFDWTTYLENLNNWANSTSYYLVLIPDSQVDWTLVWQVPFSFDCTSWVLSSWTCWLAFAWWVLWAFTVALNDEVVTHALGSSANWRSAQIGAYSYNAWNPMLLWFNQNSTWDSTDIYEKWIKIDNFTVNTYQTLSTADFRLWRSLDWANIFPYDWKIAEVIDYTWRLSDSDRERIESYLALKYGITLNWWTVNYIASDWITSIWNTGVAGTYINNIFGIWRDDTSWLSQIKSKSSNPDWIITINALWEWTNMSPSFVDIADKEFLSVSNNIGASTWTQIWNPAWYDILSRQWRVQETWDIWTLSLDFDVWNSNFDVPVLSTWSVYYFIFDSDNDNLLSDETPQSMTNISWNIWQISWVNLQNWQEFTLASLATSNNIPTNISLSNNTVNENISMWTTIGTLTTTDADLGDSHTYSLVSWIWDDDNWSFSIIWNALKIEEIPDYEIKNTYSILIQTDDWNGWTYQKQFYIYINNLWETINSIIDFETPWKYTVTSGNWSRLTTNPYENLYSLWSNNGWLPNTQSCFEVNNTFTATGTISFYYYVSSQAGADYMRFYIDNVEQQAWSGTVPWTLYTKNNVAPWTHTYKWCYIKDWATNAWTDNSYIDYITFANSNDTVSPDITSINYASWSLLPWWNHNLIINYIDMESGINTSSDIMALYKWDWTAWGADISATWLNLGWKTIWQTQSSYPTNNLVFWKYRYDFQITDNYFNSSSTWAVFYIDEPEIIISTGAFNLWNITWSWLKFSSDEIIATIKTVWASFQLEMSKDTDFLNGSWSIIIDWDWSTGVWYDKDPYTFVNKHINNNPIVWTWATYININGLKNTYTYPIKIWTLISDEQAAGTYDMSLSFRAIFGY